MMITLVLKTLLNQEDEVRFGQRASATHVIFRVLRVARRTCSRRQIAHEVINATDARIGTKEWDSNVLFNVSFNQ